MHSEHQKLELKEQFKQRRSRQLIMVLPVLVMMGVFFWLSKHPNASLAGLPPSTLSGVGIVVVVGALIFSLVNWRCPACNGYLGKGISPRFCRKCGFQLQD
jgi:protein-S-isoprenylcysteine O-methyltransferase Ste14